MNPWATGDQDEQDEEIPLGLIEEYPDEP
jgi:hypothetical protein